jgi:hypothetical protein
LKLSGREALTAATVEDIEVADEAEGTAAAEVTLVAIPAADVVEEVLVVDAIFRRLRAFRRHDLVLVPVPQCTALNFRSSMLPRLPVFQS